ncbi:MAG: pentapeptide repeat-containing protein [Lentisphaerae bacterium]|nr:pentapeptide repeat-containing protein [Lentisphaerota bacterium]MCP4100486.1 pentapeptide repeat-containing protein [Lentisphaerota bacterium]
MNDFADSIYEDETFKQINATGLVFGKKEFFGCTFKNCDFSKSNLTNAVFEDCTFNSCNLSLCNVLNTSFRMIEFKHCKLTGIDFCDVNTFSLDIKFYNSRVQMCSFSDLDLKGGCFKFCQIFESDFFGTNLQKVSFQNSDLAQSKFQDVNLEKANLKGAKNYQINPLINIINGAIFSLPEAISLLNAFEIKLD